MACPGFVARLGWSIALRPFGTFEPAPRHIHPDGADLRVVGKSGHVFAFDRVPAKFLGRNHCKAPLVCLLWSANCWDGVNETHAGLVGFELPPPKRNCVGETTWFGFGFFIAA